jgi:hypothetical protein
VLRLGAAERGDRWHRLQLVAAPHRLRGVTVQQGNPASSIGGVPANGP